MEIISLKCHYDQILNIHFFLHIFARNGSFLGILPNFNLLQTLQRTFFWTFISKNLALPLIFLFPILCWELE